MKDTKTGLLRGMLPVLPILLVLAVVALAGDAWAQPAADNPHGPLDVSCGECHSAAGWTPLQDPLPFRHATTGFPLESGHQDVDCSSCHASLVLSEVESACVDCHTDPHRGELGFACENCHSADGWSNRSQLFELHDASLFPLTGAHAVLDCAACHQEGSAFEFSATPTDCFACHVEVYEVSSDPDHGAAGFSTNCEECHDTRTWDGADLGPLGSHDQFFPLTGAHAPLDCIACHADGFGGTPTDCFACHVEDYELTTEPDHASAGFPTMCEECHGTDQWQGATFDHDPFWPLIGAHQPLDCQECHADGFAGTPTDCFACHEADYNQINDPDHRRLDFSIDCETCHSEVTWEGATNVEHDPFWPLTGGHRPLDCQECHAGGYAGTPTDCFACHQDDYNLTVDPDHAAAGFPTMCEQCHSTSSWPGATFDHDLFWPLTGAHQPLDCQECHAEGFAGTPTDCFACHQDDYNQTVDPDHAAAGFPTMCEQCHSTTTWEGATNVDHDLFWPLTGAHQPLDCQECHADGFEGTPTDCFACHEDNYDQTSDPDHAEAGFPTMCEQCHTTASWEGAAFDHDLFWPLTGAHAPLDCEECHSEGFPGTPTDCFACHEDDYNDTNDPDHQAAGFPTMCEECHNTSDWEDADFNHDQMYFPIYSGNHEGEWKSCTDCHVVESDFTVFECIFCHEHNQQDTDDDHDEVNGYVYESQACFDCHPNGDDD